VHILNAPNVIGLIAAWRRRRRRRRGRELD
jgi:hypothetical protein